mmetsp:Transcript_2849/g.5255  ORF Transcript_2849/g.5255 Transcript_2849/m.5255 type:complete len:407 (+) Transcript_2849:63-1283(+)
MAAQPSLPSLPTDVLSIIFPFLSVPSKSNFRLTSKTNLNQDSNISLWGAGGWSEWNERERIPYFELRDYRSACRNLIRKHQHVQGGDSFTILPRDFGKPTCEKELSNYAKQIKNFIFRVAGAHSYYKHMSLLGDNYGFQFTLNPFVNMRKVDGKFIEQTEGDGTRFHYTWCTTEKYRGLYGILDYYESAYNPAQRVNPWVKVNVSYPSPTGAVQKTMQKISAVKSDHTKATSIIHQSSARYYKSAWDMFRSGVDLREVSPERICEGTLSGRHYRPHDRLPETTITFFEALREYEMSSRLYGDASAFMNILFPEFFGASFPDTKEIRSRSLAFVQGFSEEELEDKGHMICACAERFHQMKGMCKEIIKLYENVGALENDEESKKCEKESLGLLLEQVLVKECLQRTW